MNFLDIIIAIVLIIFALNGLKNGLIREAFAFVAFFVGIFGAIKLTDYVGNMISEVIDVDPEWSSVISFIIVFVGLALFINWLGEMMADLIEKLYLGIFDKIGGVVFGAAKGFLLVGVSILLLDFFGVKDVLKKEACEKSKLYTSSKEFATWIYENKDGWIEKLNQEYDIVEQTIEEKR